MAGGKQSYANGVGVAHEAIGLLAESQRTDQALLRRSSDWSGQSPPAHRNGNGKFVAGLVGTLAVLIVGGLAGYTTMAITGVQRQHDTLREWMKEHQDMSGHPSLLSDIATMRETFREVETQFTGMRELFAVRIESLTHRLSVLEENGNPVHNEKIRALEEATRHLGKGD